MNEYKILGAIWWTPPLPGFTILGAGLLADLYPAISIGAVAIESYKDGSWKVYIGYGRGEDESIDCQTIAAHGTPIGSKDIACGMFSQVDNKFDPEKFKY